MESCVQALAGHVCPRREVQPGAALVVHYDAFTRSYLCLRAQSVGERYKSVIYERRIFTKECGLTQSRSPSASAKL